MLREVVSGWTGRPVLIAEIGLNHGEVVRTALEVVDAAAEAGVRDLETAKG
jgi:sialic acid synthase SpsE